MFTSKDNLDGRPGFVFLDSNRMSSAQRGLSLLHLLLYTVEIYSDNARGTSDNKLSMNNEE